MKRFSTSAVLASALALTAIACGNNPNSPKPTSAVFTAQLSPANEVPPVTNGDANASGTVTITFNNLTYRTSGEVDTGTVDFAITLNGFPLATQVTGAQIRQGPAGTVGVTIVDTGIGGVTLVTGSGSINRTGIDVDGDVIDALNTSASGFYFNVQTSANTAGALRGQLVKQ